MNAGLQPSAASRIALGAYVTLVALFLLAPIAAITAGSLTTTPYVVFPPQGLTFKWYGQIMGQRDFLSSLALSLAIGAAAATAATILGGLAGVALARHRTRLNGAIQLLVLTPVMLPSMFLGLSFLVFYSRLGIAGTSLGLFAGHVVMVTPFTVSLILIGLRAVDPTVERAARTLGASPLRCFIAVTLPLIAWSVAAGWGFAFMMSFGSLEVSLFLSTSTMVTLPVRIYTALEWSPLDPSLTAVSSGLVIVTLVVLLIMGRVARLDRLVGR